MRESAGSRRDGVEVGVRGEVYAHVRARAGQGGREGERVRKGGTCVCVCVCTRFSVIIIIIT